MTPLPSVATEHNWQALDEYIVTLRGKAITAVQSVLESMGQGMAHSRFLNAPLLLEFIERLKQVEGHSAVLAYRVLCHSNEQRFQGDMQVDFDGDLSVVKFLQAIINDPRTFIMSQGQQAKTGREMML